MSESKSAFVFGPGDRLEFIEWMYNPILFQGFGLDVTSQVDVTKVEPTAESYLSAAHSQYVTVRLEDGTEHKFSGAWFRLVPGSRTC